MKKIILIIILVILVLTTGVMVVLFKKNLNNQNTDNSGEEIVRQNQTLYININPLVKIEYEESLKKCEEENSSEICGEITTKITGIELLNSDAKRIYNNINLINKDIYIGIKKIITEAEEASINTSVIDITCTSGNFLVDNLSLDEDIEVNYVLNPNITDKDILNESAYRFTVIFDTDGGSTILSQTINNNETVLEPETPTKEDCFFVEWRLDGETYDFSTPVTKDLVLKAHWITKEYYADNHINIVTFDSNGGTKVNNQTIKEGNVAIKPDDPTKSESTFGGWLLNEEEYDFSTPVTSNITLVAKWE